MKKGAITLAIFLSALLFSSGGAYACQCKPADVDAMKASYDEADFIVLAEPVLFSKGWGGIGPTVTLRIKDMYKGDKKLSKEIVTQYNPSLAACGLSLKEDKNYILGIYDIYALGEEEVQIGGYRLMHSCAQNNIFKFLMNDQTKKEDE